MRLFFLLSSRLPFCILHLISDFNFFVLFYLVRYRRPVVQDNLLRAFPEISADRRAEIEKKFYRNFCDLMVEVVKTTTITKEEFLKRCTFKDQKRTADWFSEGVNMDGISSHLANWEWLAFAMCFELPFKSYAVYKPLSSKKMNRFIVRSRERFGLSLIPIKEVRAFFEMPQARPYLLGLLSDQAPHDYAKAFELPFLNQKTYYVPGPGILAIKHKMTACFGWMRRTGRSRFEWGLDPVNPDFSFALSDSEIDQVARIAQAHAVTLEESEYAYRIVHEYSRQLEAKIKMTPEDWLWSHRRWKSR